MTFFTPDYLYGVFLGLFAIILTACSIFGGAEPEAPVGSEAGTRTIVKLPQATDTPMPVPVPQALDTPVPEAQDNNTTDNGQNEAAPEIGEITFALGVTANYEPIEPGMFFTTGITEVHAIFDYSNMSANDTWERVWYLNDEEIARYSESWTEPPAGVFDYYINNDGRRLPPGDWMLEIYVAGELHALGVFFIE